MLHIQDASWPKRGHCICVLSVVQGTAVLMLLNKGTEACRLSVSKHVKDHCFINRTLVNHCTIFWSKRLQTLLPMSSESLIRQFLSKAWPTTGVLGCLQCA